MNVPKEVMTAIEQGEYNVVNDFFSALINTVLKERIKLKTISESIDTMLDLLCDGQQMIKSLSSKDPVDIDYNKEYILSIITSLTSESKCVH